MTETTETTALANFDDELAAMAEEAAAQESGVGGGRFFSLKNGQLSFEDNKIPDSKIAAIIIDSVNENVFYDGRYDPDNPGPPKCYAFGRSEDDMAPNPADVDEPQSSKCATCPNNEFGSAENGKGKACRNRRRLAIISAGNIVDGELELNTDSDHYATEDIAYMALPPTSLRGYASFVKKAKTILKRPPCAVVTEISVEPDDRTLVAVSFDVLDKVPGDLIPTVLARNKAERDEIMFPYPKRREHDDDTEQPKTNTRKKKRVSKF